MRDLSANNISDASIAMSQLQEHVAGVVQREPTGPHPAGLLDANRELSRQPDVGPFDSAVAPRWDTGLQKRPLLLVENLGAQFVADHIIRVTEQAFDDFAGGASDQEANRRMLGISS